MILTIRERAVFILLSKIENSSISSHFTNFQHNLSGSKCNSVFILLFKSQDQIHVNYNIENFTLIEQIPKTLSADFERIYSCFYVSFIMNGFHHHNLFNTLRIYTKNFLVPIQFGNKLRYLPSINIIERLNFNGQISPQRVKMLPKVGTIKQEMTHCFNIHFA